MIDARCPIWLSGRGFCWAPSAAWGCSDAELCTKCKAKDRTAAPVVRRMGERGTVIPIVTEPVPPKPSLPEASLPQCKPCRACGKTTRRRELCSSCLFESRRLMAFVARKKVG